MSEGELEGLVALKAEAQRNAPAFAPRCAEAVKSGRCKADCCGIFPFPRSLWEARKDRAFTSPREVMDSDDLITPVSYDGLCIFLDRISRQCRIYDSRPLLCRIFGVVSAVPCPYIRPDGRVRSRSKRRGILRTEVREQRVTVQRTKAALKAIRKWKTRG